MKRNGKVTPMTRLIERGEFEKRLADYTANVLKSFQHVLGLIAAQQEEIERLKGGGQPSATDTIPESAHADHADHTSARSPAVGRAVALLKRVLPALLLFVMGCDATITTRAICRGDSTAAIADTSLVRCATLDSLAKGGE